MRLGLAFMIGLMTFAVAGCENGGRHSMPANTTPSTNPGDRVVKSDAEWRKSLTPEQYHILREHGTEWAGSGTLLHNEATGEYRCAACGALLFTSDTKFDSGTGWPSFWAPAEGGTVATERDGALGMDRVEVHCARCGGHLGHVFEDGPADKTGLRYCINSASLTFTKK